MKSNKNWMGTCVRCEKNKSKFIAPVADGGRDSLCLACATIPDRLFSGIYPGGIVYADRAIEERGDYKRVAFLSYDDLKLRIDDPGSPLLDTVKQWAANIQVKRGRAFRIAGNASVILGSSL